MWQQLLIAAVCGLIVLASLVVAAWTLITGQIGKQGIDALFLLAVCLTLAASFALIPAQMLRQGKLRRPSKSEDGNEQ